MGPSKFFVIVNDPASIPKAEEYFADKIRNCKLMTPNTQLVIQTGIAGFKAAVNDIKDAVGVAVDRKLIASPTENVELAMKIFEIVQLPVLQFHSSHFSSGGIEKKLLESQWHQFEAALGKYSPRGLRNHPRHVMHLKVIVSPKAGTESMVFRSVTFDLSFGGCFVVLFDDSQFTNELFVNLDDSDVLVKCRVAWKMTWGHSKHHLPGVGLQFIDLSPEARKILKKHLDEQAKL